MSEFHPIDRGELDQEEKPTMASGSLKNADGNTIEVNGAVLKLTLENPYTTIEVGKWSDGHKGPRSAQKDLGAVMVAYARVPQGVLAELHLNPQDLLESIVVSLIAEVRQNLSFDGPVLCVPGGFSRTGEETSDASSREFDEETGASDIASASKTKMNGQEIATNRLFDHGRGNDVFVSDKEVEFGALDSTNADEEGLAMCSADIPLWKHPKLQGNKGQEVYFVLPRDLLHASPDCLASAACIGAMVAARQRLSYVTNNHEQGYP